MGLELPEGTFVERTYVTRSMRFDGAWSWHLVGPDGVELGIGSDYPITSLLGGRLLVIREDAPRSSARMRVLSEGVSAPPRAEVRSEPIYSEEHVERRSD